jgi:hypothetical protein
MQSFWKRWKIVVCGVALGAAFSAFGALSGQVKLHWRPAVTLEVWAAVMTGPFAEPYAYADYNMTRMTIWGVVLLAGISSHPLRPTVATAIICSIGLFLWFLLGVSYTYDGV